LRGKAGAVMLAAGTTTSSVTAWCGVAAIGAAPASAGARSALQRAAMLRSKGSVWSDQA
jgi:hypothetical protein